MPIKADILALPHSDAKNADGNALHFGNVGLTPTNVLADTKNIPIVRRSCEHAVDHFP